MKLTSLKYVQHEGEPGEWRLEDCTFGDINLIVGKNASGKTMTLHVIKNLAILIARQKKLAYISGKYELEFDNKGQKMTYILEYEQKQIVKEKFIVDSQVLLDRSSDGTGKIYADELGHEIRFKASIDEIAVSVKKDSIQHPFLDELHHWAESLIHFYFGGNMGKNHLATLRDSSDEDVRVDHKETDKAAVAIFEKGRRAISDFEDLVKADMEVVGYQIDKISVAPPLRLVFSTPPPTSLFALIVKETDLPDELDQTDLAQGMFRALSLIIQMNYALLSDSTSCILIDDIGEGLDFERSSNLIKLLIDKANRMPFQLIMTTNDRFVMNNVEFPYWNIIHRIRNKSIFINYRNSKKLFDEFELTGLNNFDLFSSSYFLRDQDEK
jgi:energy-coupling factor transporter ATP-binding protein EcfA2